MLGSGCIVLACLSQIPSAMAYGIDISPEALEIAKQNAIDLGFDSRVSFSLGSFTELEKCFDSPSKSQDFINSQYQVSFGIIVCNPPYIASKEKNKILNQDVIQNEPE